MLVHNKTLVERLYLKFKNYFWIIEANTLLSNIEHLKNFIPMFLGNKFFKIL